MEVPMSEPILPARPADRRDTLEAIARTLRGGALADPFTDLEAWVASVEVVECLERDGFRIVRDAAPLAAHPALRFGDAAH